MRPNLGETERGRWVAALGLLLVTAAEAQTPTYGVWVRNASGTAATVWNCGCGAPIQCTGAINSQPPPGGDAGGFYPCCASNICFDPAASLQAGCGRVGPVPEGYFGPLPPGGCNQDFECDAGSVCTGSCGDVCEPKGVPSLSFDGLGGVTISNEGTSCEPSPQGELHDGCGNLADDDCNGRADPGCGVSPQLDCKEKTEGSVDFTSGNVEHQLALATVSPNAGPPLALSLTYNSRRASQGIAKGWLFNFEAAARITATQVIVQLGTGYTMTFPRPSAPAADETSYMPPVLEQVAPRPLPDPAQVSRSLDGSNFGVYLAQVSTLCAPLTSCSALAVRSVMPDGQRLIFGAAGLGVIAPLLETEDVFGNLQVLARDATGRVTSFRHKQSDQSLYLTYGLRADGSLQSVGVARGRATSQAPFLALAVDPQGFLQEVCAIDGPSRSTPLDGLPRLQDGGSARFVGSPCVGARTVEAFTWASPRRADGGEHPVKQLSEVFDETGNLVERMGGWFVSDAGLPLPSSLENAREAWSFSWMSDNLARVASVDTRLFVGSDAGVSSTRTIDPGIGRLKSSTECECSAQTDRFFSSTDPAQPTDLVSELVGTVARARVDYIRDPGSYADPHRYSRPTTVTETDLSGQGSESRVTRYEYRHPLIRTPTTVLRRQKAGVTSKTVLDYDDDDPTHPCVEGKTPIAGTSAPNERPEAWLCRVLEFESEAAPSALRVTRFKYTRDGRVVEQVSPAGVVTTFFYEREFAGVAGPRRLSEVRRGGQLVARLANYFDTGVPRSITNANDEETRYTFDARGRLNETLAPDNPTRVEWEANGKPRALFLARGQVLRFEYGIFGRLVELKFFKDSSTPGALGRRTFAHDRAGNVTVEETRDQDFNLIRAARRTFDSQRHVVAQSNDHGGTRLHEYTDDLLSKTTDEKGHVTRWFHDGFGRPRVVEAPLGATSRYEFDGHDNLTKVIDPNGNATDYTFSGLGDLLAVTSKDTGATHYVYAVDGLVKEQYDDESLRRNELVERTYDALRRPETVSVRRDLDGGSPRVEVLSRYFWDEPALNAVGRLWRVEDYLPDGGVQRTTLEYDFAGRLATEQHVRPGAPVRFDFEYRYETGGTLNQIAYPPQLPQQGSVSTVLDLNLGPDDEVNEVKFGNAILASSVEHYPFGLGVKSITRGMLNFIRTEYGVDKDGRRTSVRSNAPVSFEYELDARGLVLNARHTDVDDERFNRFNTFEHDALGRLTAAEYRKAPAVLPVVLGETYAYDLAGNRLRKEYPASGKSFVSVFDWRQPQAVPPVPDNNLLRMVLDPTDGGECDVDGGRPSGCNKSLNADLARVEADWKELLRNARDLVTAAPFLTEAQLRGRVVAWVDGLRAWLTEFNLSGQTLMLLLLSSGAGPHEFMEAFNTWLDRRAAGLAQDGTDFELLKRMLNLAEKVPVRRAAVMDPNWRYTYDAAGNVTEVLVDTPEVRLVKPIETFFCYRHDALRRLVRVESTTRVKTLVGPGPTSPCVTGDGLRIMAEYRFDSRNLRTYSNVMGLETHYLFSPQGELLAEATPSGALQKQYLYLDGEPFAQVVLNDGIGVRLPSLPPGCSTAGGREDEVLFALAVLCALTLAGRRRSRVGLLALMVLVSLGAPSCTFDGGYLPGKGRGKKPRLKGADLKDPVYFFHNDRLGTPQRLTSETGATVWRGEFRPFGDIFRIEEDVDQNGVVVENNLRFPGMYDEALSGTLFQTGPYQNHHRWYSPDLGRYLSGDPLLRWPAVAGLVAQNRRAHSFGYAANDPLAFVDPNGLTTLDYNVATRTLTVDPEVSGRSPYTITATSGLPPMTNVTTTAAEMSDMGPVPQGYYELYARELSNPNPAIALGRTLAFGDWGSFRVPLHQMQSSPSNLAFGTSGIRKGFYLHGGRKPGSGGCIDVGGGVFGDTTTEQLLSDIRADPDGTIPLTVHW